MSHGGGGADEGIDSDFCLTPLLDLVLQMLMFFIINVNFVAEQVSPDIKLPRSESARPIDKADPTTLFLNQKVKTEEFLNRLLDVDLVTRLKADRNSSVILVPGLRPMTLDEAKSWLRDRYELLKKLAPDGEVKAVIHFRPDGDLELDQMFTLMKHCQTAGFTKMKLRANVIQRRG